jgi:hypothetical protein
LLAALENVGAKAVLCSKSSNNTILAHQALESFVEHLDFYFTNRMYTIGDAELDVGEQGRSYWMTIHLNIGKGSLAA